MQVAKADIPADYPFVIKDVNGWTIYLDKVLESKESEIVIDLAGWASYQRLVVVGPSTESAGACKEC
jgi:hypothetical protein